jgi:[ribosomal protein S5]-alanine N-acetyltransferase
MTLVCSHRADTGHPFMTQAEDRSDAANASMRTLAAARLTLEPQGPEHAAAMFAVLSDPAIYAFENAPPASIEALRQRYAALALRRSPDGREQWLNWVVRLRSGALIGYVQASLDAGGGATIAYELASAHWGRGLAREAVEAMIAELATTYRVQCLAAVYKRANVRSRRLLERLGFVPAEGSATAADEAMMKRRLTTWASPP